MSTAPLPNQPKLERQAAYWRQRLPGQLPVLELPLDNPRPPVSSFVKERERIVIGEAAAQKLKIFCTQHNISPFVVLLAALKILLFRYTGEKDVIVGCITNDYQYLDTHKEKDKAWNNNPVALRTDLSGDPTVSVVLSRVAHTVIEAVSNSEYPFEAVMQDMGEDGVQRSLPFRVMLYAEFLPVECIPVGKSGGKDNLEQEINRQCDLVLNFFNKDETIVAHATYDAELFESATMSRMLGHYQNLLESMATETGKRLSDLTLLTKAEHHQLLVEWNQPAADYPGDSCIHQLFEDQVALAPETVGVVFGDGQVTYGELNRRANRLAHHLQKLGVGPGIRVGVCLERHVDLIVSLLAILKAGGAYVPLDPEFPIERLEFMLQDTAIQVLVTHSALSQWLPNPRHVLCLDKDRELLEKGADRNPVGRTCAANLAYVMYTSGSTGQPKGVCVEHRAIIRLVRGTSYATFSLEEVYWQLAPLAFDASTFEIWGALLHGARLVVLPKRRLTFDEIGGTIRQYQVTTLWLTAALFHMMVSERIEALKPLRLLLAGGDVLSLQHVETVRRELKNCRLVNGYGPTEGTTFSCCYKVPFEGSLGDTVPIGRPIGNTTTYILDTHRQPIPISVRGELYIGGEGLARGYWNRPDLTAEKFVPYPFDDQPGARLFKTGDEARYRSDGNIEFLGRRDHQVKIRGYRIELGEIETTLEQQASVRQAIVLARGDIQGEKRLVAYIIPVKERAPTNRELREALAARLPDYMVPSIYVLLNTFPLTANGKVDRKALPPPEWKQMGQTKTVATPRTHTERKLADIWRQLLGLERIRIHDHFFSLGGHSLLAMRLSTRIHLVFGVDLPISQIFEAPTLEELAKRIEVLGVGSDPLLPSTVTEQLTQATAPASYAQERMWFLQQSTPNSAVYNQSFALRILGDLQVEALRKSLQALEERHDPLRTTFSLLGDQVEQHVQPANEFPLPLEDLSPMSSLAREDRWQAMASQEASRLFDISKGPLWRGRLVRLSNTEHVLLLTFHHICMDEWSLRILREELSKLYAGFAVGQTITLAPLPSRYVDYAQWQRQWLASSVADNQLEYWRTKLGSELSVLNLPTDYPRLSASNERGATERRLLSSSLLERLKKLSGEQEMTLFMTLLMAFQVLLSRYSGQDDIVVGTPIANRDLSNFQGLVGLLLNTVVMRCDLSGQPTVRETLTRVRKMALEAYTHRNVPFEKVVQAIRGLREGSTAPLFQIMFVLQNLEEQAITLGPLETTLLPVSTGTAKFDLTLFLAAKQEGLQAVMEYRTDLFEPTTIQQMLGNLEVLLEGIVSDPEKRIGELPLLGESERHQALFEWNQTAADYPRATCIHQLFEAQVARTPDAVAMVFEDCHVTYRELNWRANRLAHHLQKSGVGPEVPVGLCIDRSIGMVVGLLGILKAGGTYVPLDMKYPTERLAFMLQDVKPAMVLTNQELVDDLDSHLFQTVLLNETLASSEEVHNPFCLATPDHLAYLLFTSGSTGQPKAVAVRHQTLVNLVTWQNFQSGCGAGDRTLQFSSLSFDVSLQEIFTTLCGGGTLVIMTEDTRRDLAALVRRICEQRVTRLFLPFVLLEDLIHTLIALDVSPTWLKEIITAGEQLRITSSIIKVFERLSQTILVNQYGPTEAHVVSQYTLGGSSTEWMLLPPIGRPIWNMQLYILDETLHPVPIGVQGELYIGGDGLARGYWNRPELTAEKFVPQPFDRQPGARLYKTGDRARYRPDGNIEFLGRRDHQVKVRGYRIELGEIEATLEKHKSVRQAIVLARETALGDKQLVAYVIPIKDRAPASGELREALAVKLPDYMVPSLYVLLDAVPLTPNGKVDERALPAPDQTHRAHFITYVPPRTPLEELVTEVWRDLLKVEHLGVHDNFFALGGHSLLATQMVARLWTLLHTDVAMRTLFDFPTIAQLSATLQKTESPASALAGPPLSPQKQEGPPPLSFAQQRLWFLEQWEPGNTAYLLPYAWRLRGPLDVAALEASLTALVARHESLRTACAVVDEQPVQVIAPTTPVSLPFQDLTAFPEPGRDDEVHRLVHQEAQQPFDLTTGPLWRGQLLRLGPEDHVLLLTFHHIITDGWSMEIVFRELCALYTAQGAGQPALLPPLPTQYADFALWQRHWLQGEVLDRQLTYWRTQLADGPPSLELPTDFPRPPQQTYRGQRLAFMLPAPLTQALKRLSQQEGVTLFMTLLAAFQLLLCRYTCQRDILVGTPIAGRTKTHLEGLIGFFVNTLVIRTQLKDQPTFRDLLQQVRETCLNAFAHQDVPFEKLVEALQPVRDPSRHPIFQVMFQLHHADSTSEFTLQNLEVLLLPQVGQTAKFDLSLGLIVKGETLEGTVTFNTGLFEPTTIKRLTMHYHKLLEGFVANPTHAVSQVPWLTEAERQQLLMEWNPPVSQDSPGLGVHQLFEAQAARTPDTVAIVFEDEHLTYEALNNQANRLANYLAKQGIGPEMRVAFCLERSINLLIAPLGILKAGAAYVPLDPSSPVDRMAFILTEAQVSLGLTQVSLLNKFCAQKPSGNVESLFHPQWVAMNDPACGIHSCFSSDLRPIVSPDNLAYVIYTSGSTGQPKGVAITHANLSQFSLSASLYLGIEPGDRALQFASLTFDAAVEEIFPCLLRGGTLVLKTENLIDTVSTFWDEVTKWQLTVLDLPTAYWHEITRALPVQPVLIPDSLKLVVIGGEQARADQLEIWHQYMPSHVKLLNTYGPTEATVVAAWCHLSNTFTKGKQKPFSTVSIGHALENRTIYILDPHGEPTPIGVPGELFLGGQGLGRGYDQNQKLTAKVFVPDPFSRQPGARLYRTGDRGRYRADGTIELIGRMDHQVKIRGYRVELKEIESCLRDIAEIEEAVVIVQENEQGPSSLMAYVMSGQPQPLSISSIRQFLQCKLPPFMVPGGISQLEGFPRLPSGKIDRQALSRISVSVSTIENPPRVPKTAVEEILVQIWRELLDFPTVTVRDNFFELGGHSLLATRLLARLREICQNDFPLRLLFDHPILEDQALVIEEHLLKEIEDLPEDEFRNIEDG
jgi:amino acid adenylation domain-containing protein